MAKRNLVTNEIKKGGGGSNTKKATGGGIGYTRTATDIKTGQKITTKSGTLTPVTEAEFKSNGKTSIKRTTGFSRYAPPRKGRATNKTTRKVF